MLFFQDTHGKNEDDGGGRDRKPTQTEYQIIPMKDEE
jgi:hypothetical protein